VHRIRKSAPLLAVLLGLIAASSAMAKPATKLVYAGPPPGVNKIAAKFLPKNFNKLYNPDINAFFNKKTTINVGDTVSFRIRGFHTVDLPGSTGKPLPLILPGTGKVTGANDAAGTPFWFNNVVPPLGFNLALLAPIKGKTYNGKARIDTGLPAGAGAPKPLNVKFTKPGTYRFFCDVHPGMVGTVVVKPKGKAIPSAKQDAAATVAQATSVVKEAKKVAKTALPADTVSLGQTGPGGLELFTMFPASLTVPANTTVTFQMSKDSFETHTATFGPAPYLTNLANSFASPAPSPIAAYPSAPPGTITETPTAHGNGFANVGALDEVSATPLPSSGKIDFTTPGTYQFICLIHPFMHGTIVVK
jgi:plastocyanin